MGNGDFKKEIPVFLIILMILLNTGCHMTDSRQRPVETKRIHHNGYDRTYSYYVPENVNAACPLVIILHQSKASGSKIRKILKYRFDELADQQNFIVLYPDGYGGNWNDFRVEPKDSAHKMEMDDTGFISTLIDDFVQKYSINKSKVYVFGMSGGGHMAMRLATEIPQKIAAIAPAVAQIPVKDNLKCDKINHALPVMLISGTKDPISPYEGGQISLFGLFLRQGGVFSVSKTVAYFVENNNISIKPVVNSYPSDHLQKTMWVEKKVWDEPGKPEMRHYIVHGGGHTLPGGKHLPSIIYGKTSDNVVIADEVVSFFLK